MYALVMPSALLSNKLHKHFDHLLGDVGECSPPSEEVIVAFDSAGSVCLAREDWGGAREDAGPEGANI